MPSESNLSLFDLFEMVPDEATATRQVESAMWPKGRCCGHCGGTRTKPVPNARPMPYWCPDCRRYFSVRTGTTLARSKVPLRKWVCAFQ